MIWHTWLAFIGLVGGLAAVTLLNLIDPDPAPCLQDARGISVLRAYSLECAKQ